MYFESAGTAESRLFRYYDLSGSYYGEVFEPVIIEDAKEEYKMHGEKFVQKIIKNIQDNVAKAKHDKLQQKGE